jgi:hypothetical protein
MVQWNAQHAQDEIRDRQVAEQVQRLRVTQHMEDDMRREQKVRSQQMQHEMRVQAVVEQEQCRWRVIQQEA